MDDSNGDGSDRHRVCPMHVVDRIMVKERMRHDNRSVGMDRRRVCTAQSRTAERRRVLCTPEATSIDDKG
jgi:hypothetical protein